MSDGPADEFNHPRGSGLLQELRGSPKPRRAVCPSCGTNVAG